MKLEAVVQDDQALLYMERYVDEGAKTYGPLAARTEAEPRFRPESDQPSFELVTVNAPPDRVAIFQADPSPGLLEHFVRPQGILFAVHPQTWASAGIEGLDEIRALPRAAPIRAAPTASTRTVLALGEPEDVPAHFIKLHYPVRISRFNRRLRRKNIHDSVAVTRDIAQVHVDRFAYLPEALGFTFGDDERSWGFLVREAVPRPFAEPGFLIPCFALYGGDARRPDDPPLLAQMIERLGAEPASFVIDEIFGPIVECWAKIARERGLLLESHAQNTLLEIDRDFRPRRVVHRDFDIFIDLEARRRAGLPAPFFGSGMGADAGGGVERYYSLIYDRFIGHHFFDCLLSVLKCHYAMDEEYIRRRVRQIFHRSFPDAGRFFPAQTVFSFSNEPPPGREFVLEDLRQAPVWR